MWEYTFAPREYLHQHLETRFSRALAGMVMYSQETSEIAKPSELLTSVKAYMNVLQSVENYVNIDITRVFNNVLLQQTQQVLYFCLIGREMFQILFRCEFHQMGLSCPILLKTWKFKNEWITLDYLSAQMLVSENIFRMNMFTF